MPTTTTLIGNVPHAQLAGTTQPAKKIAVLHALTVPEHQAHIVQHPTMLHVIATATANKPLTAPLLIATDCVAPVTME